jgi:hypothetical protein
LWNISRSNLASLANFVILKYDTLNRGEVEIYQKIIGITLRLQRTLQQTLALNSACLGVTCVHTSGMFK